MKLFQSLIVALILLLTCSLASAEKTQNIDIQIHGIKSDSIRQSIINNIALTTAADQPNDNISLLYQRSLNQIKRLIQPYGYYNPSVDGSLEKDSNHWIATFNINLNQPVIIKAVHLTFQGPNHNNPIFTPLKNQTILNQGDILTQSAYNELLDKIKKTHYKYGFFDGEISDKNIQVNLANHSATVNLTVQPNLRYKVGKIHLTQHRYEYDPEFIWRFLNINDGDFFSENKLNKSIKNLQESDDFASVQLYPDIENRNKSNYTIDLELLLTSDYARHYTSGIGFSTFQGATLILGTQFKHLTPTGHTLGLNTVLSPVRTTFNGTYTIPGNHPNTDHWSLGAQQTFLDTVSFEERYTDISANWTHQVSPNLRTTFSIKSVLSRYDTGSNADIDEKISGQGNFLVGANQLLFRYMDDTHFWPRGFTWNNSFQMTPGNILSSQAFIRDEMNTAISLPINPEWNRLFFFTKLGATNTNDITKLPPSLRFYAGGMNNLLGYNFFSQGPRKDGKVIGGKYIATFLGGFEQRIYGNLSASMYYNLGNATNQFNFKNTPILKAGGIGVSYKTPIGPINLFLSRTMGQTTNRWRFDISIGLSI